MWSRLKSGSYGISVRLTNQDCIPNLYTMSIVIGDSGAPLNMPPGSLSQSPYRILFGRPVIIAEQCQTLGTSSDIILADFRNEYVSIDKGGARFDTSIHVQYLTDQSVFRSVLGVEGQPTLNSVVTPFRGSNRVSHFVCL
jgi:HK97 family phage major capsid protein